METLRIIFIFGLATIASAQAYHQSHSVTLADLPQPVPIAANLDPSADGTVIWLELTSLVDSVAIQNILINRGNCQTATEFNPQNLKFGEVAFFLPQCQILEVVVSTDCGDYSFNWQGPATEK